MTKKPVSNEGLAAALAEKMNVAVRPPQPYELDAFSSCLDVSFGVRSTVAERERFLRALQDAVPLAAFDGDELIGTLTRQEVDLTLPGPCVERVGAIADIGVLPTHRRRGVMGQLMRRALDEIHHEKLPLVLLHARDGALYRQFGFGPATYGPRYRVDHADATLRELPSFLGAPAKATVRMMSIDEAMTCLPLVFSDVARECPGEIARPQIWWDELFDQFVNQQGPPRFIACYESDGTIDGYVVYDITAATEGASSSRHLPETHLLELCSATPGAYRALFSFVLGLDGAGSLTTAERPTDEALRQLLCDPRALQVESVRDRSWIRLVDVAAALSARRYGHSGQVTFSVHDEHFSANNGVFCLTVADDGMAYVEPTGGPVDFSCEVSDLAAAYLGAVSFSSLSVASSVLEARPGALAAADLVFCVPTAPFCSSAF